MIGEQPQGAHLVGSINVHDAETAFRMAAEVLGGHLKRLPDGEVGERFHWIGFQPDRIAKAPGIERVGSEPRLVRGLDFRPVKLAHGVHAEDIVLGPLGYADAAIESFATFRSLQEQGVIPQATRFQVSLPTPLSVVGSFVDARDRAAFEPVYETALEAELLRLVHEIPPDQLAIQWDAALEFAYLEGQGYGGPQTPWFEDVWAGTSERVARQLNRVPQQVEVGVHLCYGDVDEKHFVEPKDTTVLVRFAELLTQQLTRPLNWLHLPVPIDRTDAAYFAPLTRFSLPKTTELYLGLVHREDAVAGAKRRIAQARTYLDRPFGIATECGFGRAPEGSTLPLFEAHRQLAAAW